MTAGPDAGTDLAALHRRIGLAALDREYVTVAALSDAMVRVGAEPTCSPADVWVHSGLLDRTELAELLHELQGRAQRQRNAADRLREVRATTAADGEAESTNDSFNLADVVRTYGFGDDLEAEDLPDAQREEARAVAVHSGIDGTDERYLLGGELGRGGVGRVIKAFDRDLGRTVAMKVPLSWPMPQEEIDKFIEEAQATGQLEHPSIVPVYDIGVLSSGEVYYTMKRVRAQSLGEVLAGLKAREPGIVREYGPTRLLSIFLQVCQAVYYAHVRGVVHRDLKPENIMLGDYGEVHVMDWGLARVMARGVVTDRSLQGGDKAEVGQTVGTPAYMPPEQAQGLLHLVDERSDIYSLGVILYEMITLKQPSTRSSVMGTLMAVITEPIPPPSAVVDHAVSEEMEYVIMRALERDRDDRWPSAKAFHDAVEKYLDGRNEREAERSVLDGEGYERVFEQAKREVVDLRAAVHESSAGVEDWQPIEIKRELWELEDRCDRAAETMVRSFGNAIREYTQALAHMPDHEQSRRSLARLYFSRYELAEQEENELDKVYYLSLLEQYDDGTYLGRLQDSAPLSVYTDPPDGTAFLYRYEERDRRLEIGEPLFLGETPIEERFITAGSYQLRVKHPQHPVVNLPLWVHRSDPVGLEVRLPTREQLRPGFVFVPGGETVIGGDPEAFDSLPLQRDHVEGFCIQQYPVTFAEYLEFLDHLELGSRATALARAPKTRGSDGVLVVRADGRFRPSEALIEGEMRAHYPAGQGYEEELPILAIRYEDAMAYCAWRATRDAVPYRLPTESEWERAARGADGRFFAWGNRFDANFCKMVGSRPIESQPEPVGSFPFDRSPFDVFDLSGGVREWVTSEFEDETHTYVRGGYWNGDARACRVASRWRINKSVRLATIGFRLAYSLG